MKKTLITASIALVLLSSQAFAKSGHSVSLEGTRLDVDQKFGDATYLGSDDQILPTLRYGYKFQFDSAFLRPSISYTFGDVEIRDTDGTDDKSTLSQIGTIEVDAGYNITEKLGIFGTAGIIRANFERDVSNLTSDANETGFLFGAGIEYEIIDSVSIAAKYQRSSIDYKVSNNVNDYEIDVDSIKIGVSYNF